MLFDRLPNELLQDVLRFAAADPFSLGELGRVNRRFHALASAPNLRDSFVRPAGSARLTASVAVAAPAPAPVATPVTPPMRATASAPVERFLRHATLMNLPEAGHQTTAQRPALQAAAARYPLASLEVGGADAARWRARISQEKGQALEHLYALSTTPDVKYRHFLAALCAQAACGEPEPYPYAFLQWPESLHPCGTVDDLTAAHLFRLRQFFAGEHAPRCVNALNWQRAIANDYELVRALLDLDPFAKQYLLPSMLREPGISRRLRQLPHGGPKMQWSEAFARYGDVFDLLPVALRQRQDVAAAWQQVSAQSPVGHRPLSVEAGVAALLAAGAATADQPPTPLAETTPEQRPDPVAELAQSFVREPTQEIELPLQAWRRHDVWLAFVWQTLTDNGLNLRFFAPSLREDTRLVSRALANNGLALAFVGETLRNQRALVVAAVRQNGLALAYASPRLRRDPEVVRVAARQDFMALAFAEEAARRQPVLAVQRQAFVWGDAYLRSLRYRSMVNSVHRPEGPQAWQRGVIRSERDEAAHFAELAEDDVFTPLLPVWREGADLYTTFLSTAAAPLLPEAYPAPLLDGRAGEDYPRPGAPLWPRHVMTALFRGELRLRFEACGTPRRSPVVRLEENLLRVPAPSATRRPV